MQEKKTMKKTQIPFMAVMVKQALGDVFFILCIHSVIQVVKYEKVTKGTY